MEQWLMDLNEFLNHCSIYEICSLIHIWVFSFSIFSRRALSWRVSKSHGSSTQAGLVIKSDHPILGFEICSFFISNKLSWGINTKKCNIRITQWLFIQWVLMEYLLSSTPWLETHGSSWLWAFRRPWHRAGHGGTPAQSFNWKDK